MPEDQIFGIRFGLRGFLDRHAKPVQLSRSKVDGIQLKGGTVLVGGAGCGGWGVGCRERLWWRRGWRRSALLLCVWGGLWESAMALGNPPNPRTWRGVVEPAMACSRAHGAASSSVAVVLLSTGQGGEGGGCGIARPALLLPLPLPCLSPGLPLPPRCVPPSPQGTSRGNAKMHEIVDRLRLWGINMLFVIGGNGGNAAAHAIAQECEKQHVFCHVVGVPKSIDNGGCGAGGLLVGAKE